MKLSLANLFRSTTTLATPDSWLFDAMGAHSTASGERVNVHDSLAMADVFTAVNIIAELVGTLPLKTYRDLGEGAIVEAPDHRAARMLKDAPNPVQPGHRFWSTVATHLLLWGNAFIEKLRDENGLVSELWLLPPHLVTVEFNYQLRRKRYVVQDEYGVGQRELDDGQVLHIYGVSTNGVLGLSPVTQAREALGKAKARDRFEAEVYANKPFLTGTIEHPGQLKDTVKLRDSWKAIYGGGGQGRHGVAVLEEGAHFAPIVAPLADMEFVASQNLSTKQIAALFKLPPTYLGGTTGDSLTYQTVESNKIQLATQCLAPLVHNIGRFVTFDMGIFPFVSWFAEFDLGGLMRGDAGARAAFYKTMVEVGALFPDEIRTLENLPPDPRAMEPPDVEAEEEAAGLEQADVGGVDPDDMAPLVGLPMAPAKPIKQVVSPSDAAAMTPAGG